MKFIGWMTALLPPASASWMLSAACIHHSPVSDECTLNFVKEPAIHQEWIPTLIV
jgi:hypothetical protein